MQQSQKRQAVRLNPIPELFLAEMKQHRIMELFLAEIEQPRNLSQLSTRKLPILSAFGCTGQFNLQNLLLDAEWLGVQSSWHHHHLGMNCSLV